MHPSHAPLVAVSALCLALGACQTSTPYQPRVAGAHVGGYNEQRLDADHWRVRFSGDTATSRETVEKYLLYRAAELTAEQGAEWFESLGNRTERRSHVSGAPDPAHDDAFVHDYGWGWRAEWRYHRRSGGWRTMDASNDARVLGAPAEPRQVDRYVATVDIGLGRGARPEGRRVLDARQIMAELGPDIVRPPT